MAFQKEAKNQNKHRSRRFLIMLMIFELLKIAERLHFVTLIIYQTLLKSIAIKKK